MHNIGRNFKHWLISLGAFWTHQDYFPKLYQVFEGGMENVSFPHNLLQNTPTYPSLEHDYVGCQIYDLTQILSLLVKNRRKVEKNVWGNLYLSRTKPTSLISQITIYGAQFFGSLRVMLMRVKWDNLIISTLRVQNWNAG